MVAVVTAADRAKAAEVHDQIARIYSGRTDAWWDDPAHWRDRDACREDTEVIAEWVAAALAEARADERKRWTAVVEGLAEEHRRWAVINRDLADRMETPDSDFHIGMAQGQEATVRHLRGLVTGNNEEDRADALSAAHTEEETA